MSFLLNSKPISTKHGQRNWSISFGIFLGFYCSLFEMRTAQAAVFTFTKIADNNTIFSDFFVGTGALNDQGNVAFYANLENEKSGVFTGNGKKISTIVDIDSLPSLLPKPYPPELASKSFVTQVLDINNKNIVAFLGASSLPGGYNREEGLFTAQNGKISLLSIVGGNGRLESTALADFDLNDQNSLAMDIVNGGFRINPNASLYLYSNIGKNNQSLKFITRAENGLNYPTEGLQFITRLSLNNKDTIAFAANYKDLSGHYSEQIFINQGNSIIPVASNASLRSNPSINDHNEIAFISSTEGSSNGVFTIKNGNLTNLVNLDSLFGSFESVDLNNKGTVVFSATLDTGTQGIFMGADPEADKVITVGDSLFGSTVTNLFFFGDKGLNNKGQIAFYAALADGTKGIFRADPSSSSPKPVPEPTSILSLLAFGLGSLGLLRRSR